MIDFWQIAIRVVSIEMSEEIETLEKGPIGGPGGNTGRGIASSPPRPSPGVWGRTGFTSHPGGERVRELLNSKK